MGAAKAAGAEAAGTKWDDGRSSASTAWVVAGEVQRVPRHLL